MTAVTPVQSGPSHSSRFSSITRLEPEVREKMIYQLYTGKEMDLTRPLNRSLRAELRDNHSRSMSSDDSISKSDSVTLPGSLDIDSRHLRFEKSQIIDWGVRTTTYINEGEAVIEYIGQIIRPIVCTFREKAYEAEGNNGSYVFRRDENAFIDATKIGGLARFINHSCDPNCASRTIQIGGVRRIVIYAKRDISPGEELTYDYNLPLESKEHAIKCLCGSPKCRGWLNWNKSCDFNGDQKLSSIPVLQLKKLIDLGVIPVGYFDEEVVLNKSEDDTKPLPVIEKAQKMSKPGRKRASPKSSPKGSKSKKKSSSRKDEHEEEDTPDVPKPRDVSVENLPSHYHPLSESTKAAMLFFTNDYIKDMAPKYAKQNSGEEESVEISTIKAFISTIPAPKDDEQNTIGYD